MKTYIIGIILKNHTRYISKTTITKKYKDLYLIDMKNINFDKEVLVINKKWKASLISWLFNHSYCPLYNIKTKFFVKEYEINNNKGKK